MDLNLFITLCPVAQASDLAREVVAERLAAWAVILPRGEYPIPGPLGDPTEAVAVLLLTGESRAEELLFVLAARISSKIKPVAGFLVADAPLPVWDWIEEQVSRPRGQDPGAEPPSNTETTDEEPPF